MTQDKLSVLLQQLESREGLVHHSVVEELRRLTQSDATSIQQLAEVITRDPGLTSQIMKIANSAHFNPTSNAVTAVSRAIVSIGFNTVRTLCLTIKVLEEVMRKRPNDRLIEVLARSIESAAQARMLAVGHTKNQQEEVFVAALLMHVGEMMLWTMDEKEMPGISRWTGSDSSHETAVREIEAQLGIRLPRLNAELGRQWRLGELVVSANNPGANRSPALELVLLANSIAEARSAPDARQQLANLAKQVARINKIKENEAMQGIEQASQLARDIAASFGNRRLSAAIAGRPQEAAPVPRASAIAPDPMVQLQVLQELMTMMQGGMDSTLLFQRVLDGLHRGVGLERTLIAIFDRERRILVPKAAVPAVAGWCQGLAITYERNEQNLIHALFRRGDAIWMGGQEEENGHRLLATEFRRLADEREFLAAPVMAAGRQIGVLYADQRPSGTALTREAVTSFRHFSRQLNLCLEHMANKVQKPSASTS